MESFDSPIFRKLSRFVTFASWLSILVGLAGIAGWVFHVRLLKTILPGLVTIKANTAICFVLFGTSLWLQRKEPTRTRDGRQQASRALALIVAVVGAVSLTEAAFGWDLGIDQFLFKEPLEEAFGSVRAGLMSQVTAANFLLLGLALLFLEWKTKRRVWPAQFLCWSVGILSSFTLLDFILKPHAFHTHIALQTVVTFCVIFFAPIAARAERVLSTAGSQTNGILASLLLAGDGDEHWMRNWPLRYAMTVMLVVVAALLRHMPSRFVPEHLTYATFYPAIMISAIVGGFWPGLLATLASAACADYYFLEPFGEFGLKNASDVMGIFLFLVVGIGISGLAGMVERTRRRAAEAVRRSERRLQLQLETMPVGCIVWDRKFRVESWNPAAKMIFGFSDREILGRLPYEFIVPEHLRSDIHKVFDKLLQGDSAAHSTNDNVTKDGRKILCHWTNTPLKDPDGNVTGVLSMVENITERKLAEEALQAERQRFSDVLDRLPAYVVLLAPDYHVPFANKFFRERFGESNGKRCYEYLFGRSEPCEICETYKVLQTNAPQRWKWTGPDGRHYDIYDFPFTDVDGSPLIMEMGIDITEREQAETEVRKASLYARSLLEASLDPLVTINREGKITDVNQASERVTGVPREQLIGSDFSDYFTEPDQAHRGYQQVFAAGFVHDYPLAIRHVSGAVTDVLYNASVFKNESGEVEGVFAAARDVTARKQAESALATSETRYRSLIAATAQVVWTTNATGEVVEDMPLWRDFSGQTREEMLGWGWINTVHPEDRERTAQVWSNAVAHNGLYETEYRMRRADGEYHYMAVRGVPVLGKDGSVQEWVGTCTDITERQSAQQRLKEQAALLDLAHDAIIVREMAGEIVFWSRGAEDMYGWTAQEAIGKRTHELLQTNFPLSLEANVAALKTLGKWEGELQHRTAAGKEMIVESRWSVQCDERGQPRRILEINRDITERKRAETALRESEQAFRILTDAMPQLVWMCTPDGLNVYFSQQWMDYTGLTLGESYGTGWTTPFHPEDKQAAWDAWNHATATGETYRVESRLRAADGTYRWFLMRGVPLRDATGKILKWFGTCTDIDDLKRAQEEIRALNRDLESRVQQRTAELQAILDTVPIGIAISDDPEGQHIRGNPANERMLGAPTGGELSLKAPDCVPYRVLKDGHELVADELPMQRAIRGETVGGEVLEAVRSDGEVVTMHASAAPLYDHQGRPRGAVGAFVDITAQKRIEEELQKRTAQLQESEERVRRKLESILSPDGDLGNLELADILDLPAVQSLAEDFYKVSHVPMFLLDLKGDPVVAVGWQEICTRFHRAHPEACTNCRESDLLLSAGVPPGKCKLYKCKNNMWDVVTPIMVGGQPIGNLFSGQFFFSDEPVDHALFQSQAKQYGFDEEQYMAALDKVPHLDRETVNAGMSFLMKFAQMLSQLSYSGIKLARSVAEINRVNLDLTASNKELEAFTYSVSHDLRAPLRHISGFSNMLSEELGPTLPPEAQHHLERIQQGTSRMGALVDDLLNLARVSRQELRLQVTGLSSILQEVLDVLKPEYEGRQVQWKVGILPFLECDPGLIRQVLQNLVTNALKFTRPRTQAVIEIGQSEQQGGPAIFVRDNGVGFNMKYANKLFGVFQRLHRVEDFEGTGVGLATVYRIVHKHGGTIWAEAETDKGATFYFTLAGVHKEDTRAKAVTVGGNT
jgi:PAS domain S-box-containing protein